MVAPAMAQRTQGVLCDMRLTSLYVAQLCPGILRSRRRATSSSSSPRSFQKQRIRTCGATPATVGLLVDVQPGLDRPAGAEPEAKPGVAHAPVAATHPSAQLLVAAEPVGIVSPPETSEERRKLWFAAIKPPMYSVGFMPVLVAAAAVYFQLGVVPWDRVGGFVLASILVIGWLNLSNDAFDAQTGVDKTKRESVVNLLGGGPSRRRAVLLLAKSLLVAGMALLGFLITSAPGQDLRPAGLLAFSIACGYVYQGPPFRLSYKGLGEPLCFFAFGPSATPAFYLALQPDGAAAAAAAAAAAGGGAAAALTAGVPPAVWACSVLVGLTTTVILFCSHFHQIAGDTAAGKRSPLVRLGTERGREVLRAAAVATQAGALAAAAAGALPWAVAAATAAAAPAARVMVAFADEHHTVPKRVAPLKRFAVKWHILYGLLMCLGLIAARLMGAGAA